MQSNTQPSRRSVLIGLAGIAAGTALPACSNSSSTTPGGSVELNVWGGVPLESGPNDVIAAFEKKFPTIKVKYHRYVNDPQGNIKLDTALQGGAPIDVYFTYGLPLLSKRVEADLAVDLTARVKGDDAFATLADPVQPQGVWFDQRLFSLPTARDLHGVFLNQKMLDAASVTVPDKWTIQGFTEAAYLISQDSGTPGTLLYPDTARIQLGADYWYKENGAESNFDHPAFRQYAQGYLDALKNKSAFPYSEVLSQKLEVYQHPAFLQGKFGVWWTSIFNFRYINDTKEFPRDFKVSMAPVPRVSDAGMNWNTGILGNDVMISPKSKNQDAGWDFIKFYMTEGASLMIKSGRIPMLLDQVDEQTLLTELLGPDRDKIYDVEAVRRVIFDQETKFPVDTISTAAIEINQAYTQTRSEVLLGDMSVDEWVGTMKKRADEAITKAK